VLIDWKGLPTTEQTWEELKWVAHLNPHANLEDKVRSAGEADVTVLIDQAEAEAIIRTELILPRDSPEEADVPVEPDPVRPRRLRKSTRMADYSYD